MQNFQRNPDTCSSVSISQIQQLFEEHGKGNGFCLDEVKIGRLVKDAFGEGVVRERKRCDNGESVKDIRNTRYKNIAIRERVSRWTGWEKDGDCSWIVKGENGNEIRMRKLNSDIYINDVEYSPEVVVNVASSSFTARGLRGTLTTNVDHRFPSEMINRGNIPVMVDYLESLGICTGFELSTDVPDHQVLDSVRTKSSGSTCKKMRSAGCMVFSAKPGYCCISCARQRKSVLRKCKGEKNPIAVLHTKNKCLSREELVFKCDQMKNEKNNAERRATYAREKFDRECLDVCREDHGDFVTLISDIQPDKLSEEIRLLLEQQQMALSRKSCGFRWHPK